MNWAQIISHLHDEFERNKLASMSSRVPTLSAIDHVEASVPLAAYRLGYLSRANRMWQELNWDSRMTDELAMSVELGLAQLDEAILSLTNHIPARICTRLDYAISEHRASVKSSLADRTSIRLELGQTLPPSLPQDDGWIELMRHGQRA